jgi:hypothetical protein
MRTRRGAILALVLAALAGHAHPALAEERAGCGDRSPSLGSLVTTAPGNLKRLPSAQTAAWLAFGAAGSAAAHAADRNVSERLSNASQLHETFESGAIIGGTPFQLTSAFATYVFGRASGRPCVATIGAELFRAQLMAEALTVGLKHVVRRNRPEGSGYSFPSGHTTVSFASATVLQQHFGWKVGLPAYGVAAYVAASRVQMKRHYVSDVAFGAALGIAAGRTIAFGRKRQLRLEPALTPGGAGASVTWTGK